MLAQTTSHARHVFLINFSKLCDNFVQKLLSEKRKCRELQRDHVRLSPDHYVLVQTCSLNIQNFSDDSVKKLVSEIRKCRQLQRDSSL